jgi:hypothetical protein
MAWVCSRRIGARVTEPTYRIRCEDGPRHDAVPASRLSALVATGHLDLEDGVAPAGPEVWTPAWQCEGLFEPAVIAALQRHLTTAKRMRGSVRGGWNTLMEYRAQRDQLLLSEPGVQDTRWAERPRPDLARANALGELHTAAREGAEAERAAEARRLRREHATEPPPPVTHAAPHVSIRSLQSNVQRFMHGDLPAWADPRTVLDPWRDHWIATCLITLLLAAALDPLQPIVPALRWLVIVAGACTVACALLQLGAASNDRRWGARFALALMCTLLASTLLVAHGAIDPARGALAHWIPRIAAAQDEVRQRLDAPQRP